MRVHRGGQNIYHIGFEGTLTVRQQVVAGWTPKSLPGCVLWLDASQITGLSNGEDVSSWTDLAGTNHAVQATADLKPHYTTNVKNGLPVVRFDGSNDMMQCGAACFSGAGARTIVVVYDENSTGSYVAAICGQGNADAVDTWCQIHSRPDPVGDPYIAGYADDLTGPAPDNAWKIAVLTFDGTTATSFKNGTQANTGNKSSWNTLSEGFKLGYSYPPAPSPMKGDMAEVIVYNTALSATNRGLVEDYLSAKWDIALP